MHQDSEKKRDQTGVAADHMAEAKVSDPLTRKLYECVIIKETFSCWRALGGNRRIHRKKRALFRQSTPYSRAAGSPSQPTLPLFYTPFEQVAGFSFTVPWSSATPRRVKHSFGKTQFRFYKELIGKNRQPRFKAEETEAAKVSDGLDLELRLG